MLRNAYVIKRDDKATVRVTVRAIVRASSVNHVSYCLALAVVEYPSELKCLINGISFYLGKCREDIPLVSLAIGVTPASDCSRIISCIECLLP